VEFLFINDAFVDDKSDDGVSSLKVRFCQLHWRSHLWY